jgi:signal transduction histidine kinase
MRILKKTKLTLVVESSDLDVTFSIHDQGPGVSDEIKDRLFESFFSTKNEGTGIGLNICRSVIESHNGRLWFINKKSGGCVFYFTVPLKRRHNVKGTTYGEDQSIYDDGT